MKLKDFTYTKSDIITTDGYLEFCNRNNICYIKTDFFYTGKFIWRGNIHPEKIDRKIVVGHSDYPITGQISKYFDKIFCINRFTEEENVYGIPLGITNDCNDSELHPIYGNLDIMIDTFEKVVNKSHLAYLNFNISNYPSERNIVSHLFLKEKWVKSGDIESTMNGRKKYLEEIRSSKFVFCPRGNGIDTHRLWETLYMGSIPIVKYENTHHLFTDLPILFVKDWTEVNQKLLDEKYDEIINKEWNLNKLKLSFWEDFIKKIINYV